MHEPTAADVIRAHADHELETDEAARVQRAAETDERLARQVRFERTLRERVGAVIRAGAPEAPAALSDRVRAALAEARAAPTAARVRTSWLVGPSRANLLAVAASLVVIAGAVLFGIFGTQIDSIRPGPATDLVADTAVFVSGEHQRCARRAETRSAKVSWRSRPEAERQLARHLGIPVRLPDLEAHGYRFLGAGPCHLPGDEPSGHAIFVRSGPAGDGCPESMLSFFLVPTAGSPAGAGAETLVWERVDDPERCGRRVFATIDGALRCFLVCCDDGDAALLTGGADGGLGR